MKKEFIKLAGILCIITLVAALLLACVNAITAPEIEKAALQASQDAMKEIIPEADTFETVEDENISVAMAEGEVIGYCTTVNVKGFGGDIELMVGFGSDGTVKGIDVLNHSETAGLGAKADTEDFKSRFEGKNPGYEVVKVPTESPDQVQAITGATVTSEAIRAGVEEAYGIIEEYERGE